eukprot:CAMPEP_0198669650 /NCGR_PEP_ID=MMETSP1467-20131203/76879_1 /TAXON_ID=1462469 /ORGANISM="unid. sp., Strain CCMP2135" /LENGTH=348 /DNA_ID=CAMNT_0044406405 /DNA_START=69 /DNA_END=1115 /DNA_ORIENTATION=-
MCDFSWSDAAGASVDTVPPHIRDALERAAQEEKEQAQRGNDDAGGFATSPPSVEVSYRAPPAMMLPPGPGEAKLNELVSSLRLELETARAALSAREKALSDSERRVRELRAYAHDAMRLMEREHAYLRATHLDPAVGLEIELLKRRLSPRDDPVEQNADDVLADQAALAQRNADLVSENDELAASAAAAQAERNHLRLRLRDVQADLAAAREWNDQLEEEREELYGLIDGKDHTALDDAADPTQQQQADNTTGGGNDQILHSFSQPGPPPPPPQQQQQQQRDGRGVPPMPLPMMVDPSKGGYGRGPVPVTYGNGAYDPRAYAPMPPQQHYADPAYYGQPPQQQQQPYY